MIKKIIRNIIPPIIYKFLSSITKLKNIIKINFLMVKMTYLKILFPRMTYMGSMDVVSQLFGCPKILISIFTVLSQTLIGKKTSDSIENKKCEIYYANIGIVRNWGRPINYERENFLIIILIGYGNRNINRLLF